jgi:H+-transporting ATPase
LHPTLAAPVDKTPLVGLSNADARRLFEKYGPNATPEVTVHAVRLLLAKFIAPVPCLLEAAIVLQLFLKEYVEASVIAVLLVCNAALGFLHEGRAQATIAALKSRLAVSASVLRDGAWLNVLASQIVPGDVVKLSLGSVVPADVRLHDGGVQLDQSMITGESMPIEAGPGVETYAGALVRRGEALGIVTAIGERTKFGRTAELVRTAHVVSTQQKAIFRVVRNLALLNGVVAAGLIAYAYWLGLPASEFIPLTLIAVLATVPVALPATFTLATALGAQALAKRGVLPTRLSAVDEAASMNVLCSDKTGTLTMNELAVVAVHAMPGFDKARVLGLAALASSEGGQDPVDHAIRVAAPRGQAGLPTLIKFVPFDPAAKMSEAEVVGGDGEALRIAKGAFETIAALSDPDATPIAAANELELKGNRVLGVAIGSNDTSRMAGLIALSDPPRPEATSCVAELRRLGVDVVVVTGDAAVTASVVAREVGLKRCRTSSRPDRRRCLAGAIRRVCRRIARR